METCGASDLRDEAPASSLVQVAGLVVPGARVEIDALAVVAFDVPR